MTATKDGDKTIYVRRHAGRARALGEGGEVSQLLISLLVS